MAKHKNAEEKQQSFFQGEEDVGQDQQQWELRTQKGYQLEEVVSALQKCVRRGMEDDAIFFALEMAKSGFGQYMWRRLCVIAGEDIGIANPAMLGIVINGKMASDCAMKNDPKGVETNILATVVLAMCRSPKSREACWADFYLSKPDVKIPIPDVALDMHTKRGRALYRFNKFFLEESGLIVNDVDAEAKWTKYAKAHFATEKNPKDPQS